MIPDNLIDFLRGGAMVCLFGIGVFFLRFWKDTGDRLFGYFSAAFFLMALSQKAVVFLPEGGDYAPYAYWLRFIAFVLIIVGIVEKNLPRAKTNSSDE
jgi:hypothetical protein